MNLIDVVNSAFGFSGIFSFEFRTRNPKTNQLGAWLSEFFFLLPPEEYSIQEGYKATITKTISDAWVDDFGNDIKQIKLSGSLYSYYLGNTLNNEKIPINTGISGLDEIFKLRYIVSRFRDPYTINNESSLKSAFPEINSLMAIITTSKPTYDNIGIIYHDYDDNNHYEIIFTNFTMSRSKNDPYTINYVIEMKTLKEHNGIYSIGLSNIIKKELMTSAILQANQQLTDIRSTIS